MRDPTRRPNSERLARIALAMLTYPGDRTIGGHVRNFGLMTTLFALCTPGTRLYAQQLRFRPDAPTRHDLDALLSYADLASSETVIPGDPNWPTRLSDLTGLDMVPPWCLWIRSNNPTDDLWTNAVTITGAIHSGPCGDAYRKLTTHEFAYDLARAGTMIVSTDRAGIDRCALEGAWHADRPSAVLLATGLDPARDTEHDHIATRVPLAQVTATPPRTTWTLADRDYRDTLLVAISTGVLITEAGPRDDAVITAAGLATRLGRHLFAIPGSINTKNSIICHELIRQGHARLVTSADEVLADLARPEPPPTSPATAISP